MMEEKNQNQTVALDTGKATIELIHSLSRIEAWLEIIARRQTQQLSLQEGNDVGERIPDMYEHFYRLYHQNLKVHVEQSFPGLKVPDRPEKRDASPSEFDQPRPE